MTSSQVIALCQIPKRFADSAVLLGSDTDADADQVDEPGNVETVADEPTPTATVAALPNDQDTDQFPAITDRASPKVDPDTYGEIDLIANPTFPAPQQEPEREPAPTLDLSTTKLVDHPEPVAPVEQPEPEPPDLFGSRPWATHVAVVVTTVFSALGQVLFFGPFFASIFTTTGLPTPAPDVIGWGIAIFIGGALEWSMIVFADHGIRNRDGKTWGWALPFGIGVAIALMTIVINVAHWSSYNLSAAAMFAAVGATGFAVHSAEGLFKVAAANRDRERVRAENERRQQVYEQELREWREAIERQQQREHELSMAKVSAYAAHAPAKDTKTEPADVDADSENGNEKVSAAKPKAKRSTGKRNTGKKQLTPEIARKWADENGVPGQRPEPSVVANHFESKGYEVPHVRSIRRWFEKYDAQQRAAAS